MNSLDLLRPPQRAGASAVATAHATEHPPALAADFKHAQFMSMRRAFDRHGGLFSADCMAGLMRTRLDQPLSVLARWIVKRSIVTLHWQAQTLVPIFQFDERTMTPRIGVLRVIGELGGVLDPWELALWFAEPSAWLKGASPVDLLCDSPDAVLHAARTDRFVACG